MDRPDNYLSLHNRGLGPAIITSLSMTVRGERISLLDHDRMLATVKKLGLYEQGIGFMSLETGEVLEIGDQCKLFQVNPQKASPRLLAAFNSALAGARLEVEYESLYGEKYRKQIVVKSPN